MYADIKAMFTTVANQQDTPQRQSVPVKQVYVAPVLYQYLRNLHRDMVKFTGKLGEVIEHNAHRSFMRKGFSDGYDMPDENDFRRRLIAFQIQLESYDPCSVKTFARQNKDGTASEVVMMPGAVARGFLETCVTSAEFMANFIDVLNRSEYFKVLRKLKNEGEPYSGPHSVLEYFLASFSIQMAASLAVQEAAHKPLPVNWAKGRPDNMRFH